MVPWEGVRGAAGCADPERGDGAGLVTGGGSAGRNRAPDAGRAGDKVMYVYCLTISSINMCNDILASSIDIR